ncbi:MAG: tetratricopeptide repeat protein [Opitutales bacterium]
MGFFHQADDACPYPEKRKLTEEEGLELAESMIHGGESTAGTAASILITYRCVEPLMQVLRSNSKKAAQLAENGIWEIWHSEKGDAARNRLENGMRHLSCNRHCEAIQIFQELMHAYPDWIEPRFKAATVLFFKERLSDCVELCKTIVDKAPQHFGAWHTIAMCALQLGECCAARVAIEKVLELNPHSQSNRELIEYLKQIENC